MEYLKLGILWLLFFVPHSLLAANGIKENLCNRLPFLKRSYRFFYNLQSLFFFAWAFYFQRTITPLFLFEPIPILQGIALFFMGVGLTLMLLSFKNYSAKEFVGIQQWRQQTFNQALSETLNTSGLNQYVRHPLYTASFLFLWAYLLYQPHCANMLFVALSSLYLVAGTYLEEQKLIKQFGQEYKDYQEKVGRFW
jgi:protein-S-isoprenylcysteine O-methyltransferase Ste14